ncbi:hypothetical protein [Yersinia alsatica]|uniref:hypothetical protein n=1 Tax=Yersinia alsatica TaxID=2890317 RepID=UPI0039A3EE58
MAKLLPPTTWPWLLLHRVEGISEAALYNWRNQAKHEGKPVPGAEKTTDQWSAEASFVVIVETATLSEAEIAEYCRKKRTLPGTACSVEAGFYTG